MQMIYDIWMNAERGGEAKKTTRFFRKNNVKVQMEIYGLRNRFRTNSFSLITGRDLWIKDTGNWLFIGLI